MRGAGCGKACGSGAINPAELLRASAGAKAAALACAATPGAIGLEPPAGNEGSPLVRTPGAALVGFVEGATSPPAPLADDAASERTVDGVALELAEWGGRGAPGRFAGTAAARAALPDAPADDCPAIGAAVIDGLVTPVFHADGAAGFLPGTDSGCTAGPQPAVSLPATRATGRPEGAPLAVAVEAIFLTGGRLTSPFRARFTASASSVLMADFAAIRRPFSLTSSSFDVRFSAFANS